MTDAPAETQTCTQCGVVSTFPQAFRRYGRGKKTRWLCPPCTHLEHEREWKVTLVHVAVLILLGASVAILGKSTNPGWLLLNIALLYAMALLTILPHEAGHALVAKLVRFDVERIVVGIGRRLFTAKWFGVPVEVHLHPVGGATHVIPHEAGPFRLRWACVFIAGPLVNLLLMLAAIEWGEAAWKAERIESGLAPVSAFIAANFAVLVGNLWPRSIASQTGATVTDGAMLLALLQRGVEQEEALARQRIALRVYKCYAQRDWQGVESATSGAALERPELYGVAVTLSAALIHQHKLADARKLLSRLLETEAPSPWFRAVAMNNLAWVYLLLDDAELADEANKLAADAYAVLPWEAYVASTYGCSHALFGDAEIAIRVLTSARVQSNPEKTLAASLAGSGLAYLRAHRHDESAAALARARGIDPQNALLSIVVKRQRELAETQKSSVMLTGQ